MNRPLLKVDVRERTRKNQLKDLRKEGCVPGILYGYHKETKNVSFDKRELDRVLSKYGIGSSVILQMQDRVCPGIIKDIQRHIINEYVLHVDLQELDENEKIRVSIPLYLKNKLSIDSNTTVLQQQITEIEIQTYPQYLPQSVEVDVSNMKFGEPLKVKELSIFEDENIEIINDPEGIIALLTAAFKVEEQEEELSQDDLLKRLY